MLSNTKAWVMATATVFTLASGFFVHKHNTYAGHQATLSEISYTSTAFGIPTLGRDGRAVAEPVCKPEMAAEVQDDAIVVLQISAPCLANEWVTLHHSDLVFSEVLDDTGLLKLEIPAMTKNAVFTANFSHAPEISTAVLVEGLNNIERVAMQFSIGSGFELHALEYDATYGDFGHVWAQAATGQGTLTVLGQPIHDHAQMVQIYSAPYQASRKGHVHLSIETEVTAMNCGRVIPVHVRQYRNNSLNNIDLQIPVSECDVVGDFLVLNNLIESLNIATN